MQKVTGGGKKLFFYYRPIKLPRVGMAVAIGETPLHFFLRKCIQVEFVLVIATAADNFDNFLRQFVGTVWVAILSIRFY